MISVDYVARASPPAWDVQFRGKKERIEGGKREGEEGVRETGREQRRTEKVWKGKKGREKK